MTGKQTDINEDDELIEDAIELLKTGEFKNDLNLQKTITMFQRRFRIGWRRGFNLANVLRDRGILVNPIVDEEISEEMSNL
ncbi:hypothetical protein [Leuconostoc sp. LN180020]|uniref:hypothetical protein n=1 Tax=Leuconostoc sp. LN180020 TaxID=2571156 RepID=UPI001783FFB9|nr:hypothetical protein [Leuconostoc sp. LN180020]QOG09357.1 hypothetical protein FAZ25_00070 [Leuconostoc sp. LN180020]